MAIIHFNADPYTAEQLPIYSSSGAIGLSTSNYLPTTGIGRGQGAQMAFITLESTGYTATGQLRYHMCGQTPATGCGHIFYVGDALVLDGLPAVKNFRVVMTSAATSTIVVTYFID